MRKGIFVSVSYARHPNLQGLFEPARFDVDVYDCEVEGTVPADLDGIFHRVGAEWFYPPRFPDDSPFAADGYMSTFTIKGGNVDFRGKYVRTPRYLANAKARQQLFGYYRNPFTDDPRAKGVSGTVSNTNTLYFAGRLFALKEDALPYEIDLETLDTKGPFDFAGGYKAPTFTAHPKVDGRTGELVTYGYEAEGLATNAIWIYTIDPSGTVTSERKISAPYLSMVHDISLSQDHILIPVYGMTGSMERLKAGKIHWGWDKTLPSYIGVVPRKGNGAVRWFKGPEMAMIHVFSAMEEKGKLVLYAAVSDSNPFPFFPAVDGAPFDAPRSRTTIRKYTMDLKGKSDTWQEERLFENCAGALSRIDDRYQGRAFRYGFLGYADTTKPWDEKLGGPMRGRVTNSYGRFDFQTGKVDSLFAGPTHMLSEVCFAPRSPDAPEGDGWILGVANNAATHKSELIIGDTRDLAAGPVARVKLPFKAPGQIHGNWAPRWDLDKATGKVRA